MSDWLWLAAILLGIVLIITGIQYIYIRAIRGEFENDKTSYNKFLSFNKELDAKMEFFYNKNVTWLKTYMNFILPLLSIMLIWGLIQDIAATVDPYNYKLFLSLGLIILTVLDVFMIRNIDKFGFIFNIVVNVAYVLKGFLNAGHIGFIFPVLVVLGIPVMLNIFYFYKRRELFFKSAKQLKLDYDIDNG